MNYDLQSVRNLCEKLGLRYDYRSPTEILLDLGGGAFFIMRNDFGEDEGIMGLAAGAGQVYGHDHGQGNVFSDGEYYCEMSYLDVIRGLADRTILIGETWTDGELSDRFLLHTDFSKDLLHDIIAGEEFRIRPALAHEGTPNK